MSKTTTIGRSVEITRELPVDLTREELIEFKDSILGKLDDLEKLQNDAANVAADYRARIKIAQGELKTLRDSVDSKTTMRKVACREDFHFKTGVVKTYRLDRDKIVDERTILPSERQDDIEADVEAGRSPPATMPDPGKAPSGGK